VTENQRGRHRSSDKEGKKTIALLKSVPGVTAVVIGRSYGGKSLGGDRAGLLAALFLPQTQASEHT
jgi:hypothetical protein